MKRYEADDSISITSRKIKVGVNDIANVSHAKQSEDEEVIAEAAMASLRKNLTLCEITMPMKCDAVQCSN